MLNFRCKLWLFFLGSLAMFCSQHVKASPYFTLVSSALRGSRKGERLPGCYLGGQHYRFGERWSPVMEPRGLVVCLKCECLQVEKKGIVQTKGNTVCRNIRHRCPDVTCSNPYTLPGRCCKICKPEDDFEASLSFQEERPPLYPPEHLPSDDSVAYTGNNVYTSLLTAPSPGMTSGVTPVGDLRLTMTPQKGQLTFSLRFSDNFDLLTNVLQLVDEHGDIQLQHSLGDTVRGEKKICGTWNEVPSVYKSYLNNGQLMARISTIETPDEVISGKITPDSGSDEELLSGVIHPAKIDGSGGNVKVKYNPRSHTAGFTVTTRGLGFDPATKPTFRLIVVHKSRTIFQSSQLMLSKFNQLVASWRVRRKRHRRLLARGKLRMRVLKGGDEPDILLEGALLSRLSCDAYQAVGMDMTPSSVSGTPLVSSAVVSVGDKGWLGFQFKVEGASHTLVRRIILEGSRPNHKRHVIWKKSYQSRSSTRQDEGNNNDIVSGRYSKLDMDTLYRLRHNRMYVTFVLKNKVKVKAALVTTGTKSATVNGNGSWVTLPPSIDKHGKIEKVAAQLQMSLSPDCSLQVTALASFPEVKRSEFNIHLSIAGSDDTQSSRVKDKWRAAMEKPKFLRNYAVLDGQFPNLPGIALLALDRGYAYLWVTLNDASKDLPSVSTKRMQIRVPNQCWRSLDTDLDSDTSGSTSLRQQLQQELKDEGSLEEQKDPTATQERRGINGEGEEPPPTCTFEGQVYEEGSAWLPDVNARCNTCSCVKGEVICPRMICPKLDCSNPVHIDGECCPSCPVEPSIETCQLGHDPRTYRLHTTWHPYLPLEGFTRCAICTCLHGGRSVCSKTECPALSCDRSRWVKSKTDPCCHACAPDSDEMELTQSLQQDINMEGACFDRGQIRRNGETWNPTIQTFGFMKCIQCHCKDGSFKCEFLKCPKLTCTRKRKIPNVCCEVCEDGSSNIAKDIAKPMKKPVEHKTRGKKKTKKKRKACKINNRLYTHGEKWRPQTVKMYGNCAVCRCKNGKANCRMRCPKTCETDKTSHRCCQYCDRKLTKDGKVTKTKESPASGKTTASAKKIASVYMEKINLIKFLQS